MPKHKVVYLLKETVDGETCIVGALTELRNAEQWKKQASNRNYSFTSLNSPELLNRITKGEIENG